MNTQIDISNILLSGKIDNELDFERALIADRKLRVLSKKDNKYGIMRKQLRDVLEAYERKNWSADADISNEKIQESDLTEAIAEKERLFVQYRKGVIKNKLKSLNLNQQDFGLLLGHSNKSYISELMNGFRPFSLKDIIVINRLLKIELTDLIPTFLSHDEQLKIKTSIQQLNNPKLKLSEDEFELV